MTHMRGIQNEPKMEGKEKWGDGRGLRNTLDEKEKMRGLDEAGVFAKASWCAWSFS